MITTIYSLLLTQARHCSRDIAVTDGNQSLQYNELLNQVNNHANQLLSHGVNRGDRVAIHLPKSMEEIIATFAISAVGGIIVNINYQSAFTQVSHVIQDAQCNILITDSNKLRRTETLSSITKTVIVVGSNYPEGTFKWAVDDNINKSIPEPNTISHDIAALLYTSGSTGTPKGVVITHRNLLDGANIVIQYLKLTKDDRILSVPPFNFDYGLNQLLASLALGATLVLQRVVLATEILNSVQHHKITVLPLVAPSWVQYLRLLSSNTIITETLRIATNTGGKIPQNLLELIPSLMPNTRFFLMYGLTEAFRSTYLPPELFKSKMGAIGKAVPDNEVFVVDSEKGICCANETGELIHRGCFVSKGYWGKPELSQEKIRPNPHLKHICGDEAVVHSGDLVHMDEDGILWFEGRNDDMIKCSGFRISPTEIEDILAAMPATIESIAFGISDDELGHIVHAVIVSSDPNIDTKAVVSYCRGCMPSYMIPKSIHFRETNFPRTANGKIDRVTIIDQIKGNCSDPSH